MSRVLRITLWSVGILAVVLGATLFWVESQLRPEPLGLRVKGLLADAKIKGGIARIEASLDGKFSAEGIDLTLTDGNIVSGAVAAESDTDVTLRAAGAPEVKIAKAKIKTRSAPVSIMPPMSANLSLREMRNVVAYLATLK